MADAQHNHTIYASKAKVPYKHLDNLGHGSYALVDKVETIGPNPKVFARKVIRTGYFRAAAQKESVMSEISIIRRLRHIHIVELVETYQAGLEFGIIMAPVADMDLGEYLARADSDEEFYRIAKAKRRLCGWVVCLARAVEYLHDNRIRHKDLKPANVLIKGYRDIFITDFGISKDLINDSTTGSTGFPSERTVIYCAPEANIEGARRGRAADMFSLGCILLEMMTVALGFGLAKFEQYRTTNGSRAYATNLCRVYLWIIHHSNVLGHPHLLPTMAALLDIDPQKRPRASELPKCDGVGNCNFLYSLEYYNRGLNFNPDVLPQLRACSLQDRIVPQVVQDGTWLMRDYLSLREQSNPLEENGDSESG